MSRYNTQVLSSIRMLCRMQNIDEKVLYERAKLILSIYREVCWSTIDRANDVCDTLICTYGDSLDGALIYLENFAPDEARERFEERIRSLSRHFPRKGTTNMLAELRNTKQQSRHCLKDWDLSICLTIAMN